MRFFNKAKYIIAVIAVLLAGCAGTGQQVNVGSDKPVVTENKSTAESDFDPLQLDDYELALPSASQQTNYYTINDLVKSDLVDTTSSDELVAGYRVQLISTRTEEEASAVKMEAVLTFEENVYTIFDNPYYKIRVGDCLTRYDANTLQELAVKKGFNEAWVVKTNVFRSPVLQHLSRGFQD